MENTLGYRKLIVFQKSLELIRLIYQSTQQFPRHEVFGLTSQIRRAAVSIALNIAEGYVRNSRKDYSRFISISLGSCAELDVLLEISFELNYLNRMEYDKVKTLRDEIGKLLYVMRRNLDH